MAEPLNATFFAFKKRDPGGALLGSGIAFGIALILVFVAFCAAAFAILGPGFLEWYSSLIEAAAQGAAEPPPPPNPGGILLLIPLYFLFLFTLFVVIASFESACLRWMIRGERSGPLGLCFGADMWRVYATYWVILLLAIGSCVLFWIVMFLTGLAVQNSAEAAGIVGPAVLLAWVLAWIYAAVRLAPAAATSVGIGKFSPMKAWSVTRDRFWAMFGAFLLLFVIYMVAAFALGMIFFGTMYAAVFGQLDWTLASTDPVAFNKAYEQAMMSAIQSQLATPTAAALYIGGNVVMFAFGVVFYILFYGVNARAVQAALEEGKVEKEG